MAKLIKVLLLSLSMILLFGYIESFTIKKYQLAEALHLAIKEGQLKEIDRLLKQGADPFYRIQYLVC